MVLFEYIRFFMKHKLYSAESIQELNQNAVFMQLINKVNFKTLRGKQLSFGTPEITKSGLPKKINNVNDLCAELESSIHNAMFAAYNDSHYADMTTLGDLHIYTDGRPMRFVPV